MMDFGGGVGMLMLAGVVGGGALMLVAALVAWHAGRRPLALGLLAAAAATAALYVGAVGAVSLATPGRALRPGEAKRFCGFYLDCHLGVSVDGVGAAAELGTGADRVRARGRYMIVTLRVSSDAKQATLQPYGLVVEAVDERERRHPRDLAAERALLGAEAGRRFEERVRAGESYTRVVVFDLPRDVRRPALQVSERGFPDVLIETFLIGDEDSWLHRPTLLAPESSAP